MPPHPRGSLDRQTLLWIFEAGAATGLGGLALLAFPRPSERLLDALLGFTAGVMLAATGFSLLVPGPARGGVAEVLAGVAIGGASMLFLDMAIPHAHARFAEPGTFRRSRPRQAGGRRCCWRL